MARFSFATLRHASHHALFLRGALVFSSVTAFALAARAQDMGAPPPEAAAVVSAPKDVPVDPKIEKKDAGTAITLSAGGQLATGNSRLLAGTANGAADKRWDDNGLGFSLLANYGRSAPPGAAQKTTAENIQGRARYDRYVLDNASVFLLNTLRHDRFQGLNIRYNLDPGFKYIAFKDAATSLGLEAGYDFQYDVRRESARAILDDMMMPTGELLPKTATDHSLRAYAGFKHAFNSEVTFSTGLEYLQSVVHTKKYRFNYDALFAAKVAGGLAVGLGFTLRYDHDPLQTVKHHFDTATTVSIIYAYSDEVAPPPAPPPEEPPPALPAPAPAPPIPAEPAPAAAPEAAPATPDATGAEAAPGTPAAVAAPAPAAAPAP